MTYASDLIECAHCGSPIAGERKTKMTKSGERDYVYYRCTQYRQTKGLVSKDSRGDWRSFERMVEEYAATCLATPSQLQR